MGREDVERALRAMDDDDVRQRLSRGEYQAVSGLDLTDEERTLVRDAAGDYPEVAGFSFANFQEIVITKEVDKASPKLFEDSGIGHKMKFWLAMKYSQAG